MKKLVKQMYRLQDLVETQIEGKRRYVRAPFSDDLSSVLDEHIDFNRDVDEDELREMLNDLTVAIYGADRSGRWAFFTDDLVSDIRKLFSFPKNDGEWCEFPDIPDITDSILGLSEDSVLYILFNAEFTEHKWVVADPRGAVYLDANEDAE